MKKFDQYVVVAFTVAMVLIACLASCHFGGAKVEADVAPYGNAAITIEPGTLELPDPPATD